MPVSSAFTMGVKVLTFLSLVAVGIIAIAQNSDDTSSEFFERNVRPLLVARCLKCHSADFEVNGGLSLDSKAGWSIGGDSGPAIDPSDWQKSLLWSAVDYRNPKLQMPPDTKLSERETEVLQTWLSTGAFDPRIPNDPLAKRKSTALSVDEAQSHWAYCLPRRTHSPDAAGLNRNAIDAYLAKAQSELDLVPSDIAMESTLRQRLFVDLHGMRPSVDQIDGCDLPYEEWVDSLLASPRFGERFARHWMDAVRFAESITLRGFVLPDAWRYRNYLINSFNEDKPISDFIREQVAGDLMQADSLEMRQNQWVATTALALGDTNLEEQDKKQLEMDYVDEQLEMIGKVFLAQTIGCARCHDHKFDPIPTRDYYALAGIMKSSVAIEHSNVSKWISLPLPLDSRTESKYKEVSASHSAAKKRLDDLKKQIQSFSSSSLVARIEDLEGVVVDDAKARRVGSWDESTSPAVASPSLAINAQLTKEGLELLRKESASIETELKDLQSELDTRPMVMSLRASEKPSDLAIHVRGSVHQQGVTVPRGFLSCLPALAAKVQISAASNGRLELANWLTSDENPLTSRVYVNRVWSWLMGEGIVRTIDNFGTTGEHPSNLDLLDWLTLEFVQHGWSTKWLVREILLSDAYKRSSKATATAMELDPDNRVFARSSIRRLDAESIRDTLMGMSGELDLASQVGSIAPAKLREDYDFHHTTRYRSVFGPWFRNALPELYSEFDGANPSFSIGKRNRSTIAPQALTMLNSQWIAQRTAKLGRRLAADFSLGDEQKMNCCFLSTLSRLPSSRELEWSKDHVRHARECDTTEDVLWGALVHALVASIDFRYVE